MLVDSLRRERRHRDGEGASGAPTLQPWSHSCGVFEGSHEQGLELLAQAQLQISPVWWSAESLDPERARFVACCVAQFTTVPGSIRTTL